MIAAGGHHRFRCGVNQVVHDRQVVRRQIPNHAHIVLKQAEIHPSRIKVVERPQRADIDELAHLAHRAAEQKRVIDHEAQIFPLRQFDQLLGLSGV